MIANILDVHGHPIRFLVGTEYFTLKTPLLGCALQFPCKKPALLVPNADDTVVGACDEIEPWNQVVPVADYIIYHSC